MNQQQDSWTIVDAKLITEQAPLHLQALQIRRRPVVGSAVSLCAVGDIGLSGRALEHKETSQLFGQMTSVLGAADIAFGNLETSLTDVVAPGQKFVSPLSGAALLCDAGFNILHLANNHIADFGKPGLTATLQGVAEAGMQALGAGHNKKAAKELIITSINGLRIGWLGCGRTLVDQGNTAPFYWEFNEQELLEAVKGARSKVDVLIVSIHIGFMYLDYPCPTHKAMAEKLMGNGADLILMHHAHVLQGIQITPLGNVCCYNLGNFLFDCKEGKIKTPVMEKEQNEGAVIMFTFDQDGIAQVAALPTCIDDHCRVSWATGSQGVEILERLTRISQDLEGDFLPAFNQQRAERNAGHTLKVLWSQIRNGSWEIVLASLRKIRPGHLAMGANWLRGVLGQMVKRMMP